MNAAQTVTHIGGNAERIRHLCCAARLRFIAGMKILPVYLYMKYNSKKHIWEKKVTFGPEGVTWIIDHHYSWPDFLERAQRLNELKWVRLNGGFNGLCLVCGRLSGVIVLDLDTHHGIDQTMLKSFVDPSAPMELTTTDGEHYFHCYDPEIQSTHIKSLDTCVLSDGKLCYIAPSNISGRPTPYRIVKPFNWPKNALHQANTPGFVPVPDPSLIRLPAISPALRGFLYGLQPEEKESKLTKPATMSARNEAVSLPMVSQMLKTILQNNGGSVGYDDWTNIIGSIWSRFSFEETLPIFEKYMPEGESAYKYRYDHRKTHLSMGTLFYYFRQCTKI